MIAKEVYLHPILNNVPRLLGLLNRNISSANYGCFDRDYWHYNIVEFSCARKQEAVLTLALLYLTNHEKNRYYKKAEILSYIRAALIFWSKIQNKNGSFNEWYPNENSFVVTAFTTYAVSECLILMKNEIPENEYQTVLGSLKKAGEWLIKRNEIRVMNQQAGAAVALLNLYLLTKDSTFLDSSRNKIALLEKKQSQEGWFIEYGGPDIGYLSLAIDYLCKYYHKMKNENVKEIIFRSLDFIKFFIQPSLVAGGVYTSRNTEYLIPHGFEIISGENENALFISSVIRKSLLSKESFPYIFDDRYMTYVSYTWIQAYHDANSDIDDTIDDNIDTHFNISFKKYFPESGFFIKNDPDKHLVINTRKGGAFRLFEKKSRKTYSDSGVLINSDNIWYTSGWLVKAKDTISEDMINVAGNMWQVPDKTLTSFNNILLRLFQMTLGRMSLISLFLKEKLRDILITKTKPSDFQYLREICFDSHQNKLIEIKDTVFSKKLSISTIVINTNDTHIYVPSSRYYVGMKDVPILQKFTPSVQKAVVKWEIIKDYGITYKVNE